MADDVDVEAQWYDEHAGSLEALAAQFRRAAGLLRVARGVLSPSELAALRAELAAITRGTFASHRITLAVLERRPHPEGGLK